MAIPAMKLLRHFPAGFGPRTRCCEKNECRQVRHVCSAQNKNRPRRQLVQVILNVLHENLPFSEEERRKLIQNKDASLNLALPDIPYKTKKQNLVFLML